MDAALPRKHWKIYNFTITNAVKMKRTTIMYLNENFNFKKRLGHNLWGVRGQI